MHEWQREGLRTRVRAGNSVLGAGPPPYFLAERPQAALSGKRPCRPNQPRAGASFINRTLAGIGILMALSSTGCLIGPDPRTPATQMPDEWASPLAPTESPTTVPAARASTISTRRLNAVNWWSLFNDPELNSLIARAVASNLDLKVATAQIRQSRAARGIVASGLFPTLSSTGSYSRSFSGGPGGTHHNPQDLFSAGFDASWEIDIFGGQRRGVQAADANVDATIYNRRDVLVTLAAEVATAYIELRGFQGQIAIARDNLDSQRKTADLTRRRQRGGFQTGLDVANADATVAATLSTIPILEQSAQQTIYSLSVLLGTPPATLNSELTPTLPIPIVPPEVPIGLPSELLRRRPDVRRAEYQLRAQTAQVGVAVSSLYPRFSLTGSGGLQGGHFSALGNWSDRFWSFGPSVDWPILDFGAIRSNIEVQNAVEEQNLYVYQKSVLLSLQDVENALIAYTKEQQHHKALEDSVIANRRAVELSTLLYSNGSTDFLNVLTAQRSLFGAQTALVQSDTTMATNLAALYKALGGGWEGMDSPTPATTPPVTPTLNVPISVDNTRR